MGGSSKFDQYPVFLLFQAHADEQPVKLLYFLDDDPASMIAFVQTLFAHAREYKLTEAFVANAIRGACDMLRVYELKRQQQQQKPPDNFGDLFGFPVFPSGN